jgi:hypothetical protein
MKSGHSQPSLFGFNLVGAAHLIDGEQATEARKRMRGMIARLAATSEPPWKDQMAAILDDGAFQRAMRFVPHDEAQKLWAEYDAHMERLYDIWAADNAEPATGNAALPGRLTTN